MTKQQQYNEYQNNGGTMTIKEWEMDGRYDPSAEQIMKIISQYIVKDKGKNQILFELENGSYMITTQEAMGVGYTSIESIDKELANNLLKERVNIAL